ncbi:hypothetical protein M378DRAFT_168468, partial [Amanita muscaria Koide BX008]
ILTRSRIPLAQRIQKRINRLQGRSENESPTKGKDVFNTGKRPSSRASLSPVKFGGERMQRAKSGHFKRPSLEANCLTARGEDAVGFFQEPSFGACNSSNSHGEGSSFSSNPSFSFTLNSSRASFSPSKIPTASPSMESPLSRVATAQIRARMRGHHMRAASRSFAHETIHEMQEEVHQEAPHGTLVESPSVLGLTSLQLTTPTTDPFGEKNRHKKGKRKTLEGCYALKHEAELTVTESKKEWVDTPYSIAIVQNFNPPKDAESMKTLLQDSMKIYRPLPAELRAHRRRNSRNLRSSPYAQSRLSRASMSSITSPRKGSVASPSPSLARSKRNSVIMEDPASPGPFSSPCASVMLQNVPSSCNPSAFTNETRTKPFTPREVKPTTKGADSLGFLKQGTPKLKSRSSISLNARQLQTPCKGLTKRDQKNKENVNQETPSGSLKIDRPRPRYRTPTPGPKRRPAKI